MADKSDDSKRDKLKVMRMIGEGKNRIGELAETLDWTRDRVEETVDDLKENKYVKQATEGGDQVLEITDRGVREVPEMARDVANDTRDFVDNVMGSFQKHFNRVTPNVTVDVNVDKSDEE